MISSLGCTRRSLTRRVVGAVAACLLVLPALPALGCGFLAPPVEQTRTSTLAHVVGSSLSVESANGGITVTAVPEAKEVTVTAKLRARTQERLDATRVLAERKPDNSLSIYVKWPDDSREGNEGCSFEIKLPDVKGVMLNSSNGALTLSGSSGAAELSTSNGAVTVKRHDGEVKVKTNNGAVTGEAVNGAATVHTSNGAITFSLAPGAAGPVTLESSNGAVTLHVGNGFAGDLSVKTSNGSVTLPEGVGIAVKDREKHSAKLEFGTGGGHSSIRTSNGSVTVTREK